MSCPPRCWVWKTDGREVDAPKSCHGGVVGGITSVTPTLSARDPLRGCPQGTTASITAAAAKAAADPRTRRGDTDID
ncbi:unnamed protein product [Ectocarpus sp. CCAP 1310/34]|nr:unnamed protein product [Ectocarpus sp. CCAP 1310/34]